MKKPNFFIIGQSKAGTSSLHGYLRQHPQIFMPNQKELRFFSNDLTEPQLDINVRAGLPTTMADYLANFAPATHELAIGEASPQYIESPYAAQQILDFQPDAKLIVSLRNPVDRLYSLHQMHVRAGEDLRDFSKAYHADIDETWVSNSHSTKLLSRFYDVFDFDRIFVFPFERFANRPNRLLHDIFDFLDVEPSIEIDTSIIHNKGGLPKSEAMHKLFMFVNTKQGLRDMISRSVPTAILNMARKTRSSNLTPVETLDPALKADILLQFADYIDITQQLTGVDLGHWRA